MTGTIQNIDGVSGARRHFRYFDYVMAAFVAILLLSNLFSAWLLWRTGWPNVAVLWFLAMTSVHFGRWWLVRGWARRPPATVRRCSTSSCAKRRPTS